MTTTYACPGRAMPQPPDAPPQGYVGCYVAGRRFCACCGTLAVADWLDLVARLLAEGFNANAETAAALTVARVYVREGS